MSNSFNHHQQPPALQSVHFLTQVFQLPVGYVDPAHFPGQFHEPLDHKLLFSEQKMTNVRDARTGEIKAEYSHRHLAHVGCGWFHHKLPFSISLLSRRQQDYPENLLTWNWLDHTKVFNTHLWPVIKR